MKEKDFTLLFRHWLKAHPMYSGAFELKQTTKESILFSAVAEHQINALLAVKRGQFLYKIPDDSRGAKPFDCVYFNNGGAWVVIKYNRFFVIIDIDAFVLEQDISGRKSLQERRAQAIAEKVVPI
jgi:penicillin-binding protein-related factor A (putative recombinase)